MIIHLLALLLTGCAWGGVIGQCALPNFSLSDLGNVALKVGATSNSSAQSAVSTIPTSVQVSRNIFILNHCYHNKRAYYLRNISNVPVVKTEWGVKGNILRCPRRHYRNRQGFWRSAGIESGHPYSTQNVGTKSQTDTAPHFEGSRSPIVTQYNIPKQALAESKISKFWFEPDDRGLIFSKVFLRIGHGTARDIRKHMRFLDARLQLGDLVYSGLRLFPSGNCKRMAVASTAFHFIQLTLNRYQLSTRVMYIEASQDRNYNGGSSGYPVRPFHVSQKLIPLWCGWIILGSGIAGCTCAYCCAMWSIYAGKTLGWFSSLWRISSGLLLLLTSFWLIHFGLNVVDPVSVSSLEHLDYRLAAMLFSPASLGRQVLLSILLGACACQL